MHMKLLVLALVSSAVAEDFTDSPYRWPDMLRSGGRVVHVLSSATNPRPSKEHYPNWYNKYPLRFVEDIAVPPGEDVAGGEIVILEHDISEETGLGGSNLKNLANNFGYMGQALMEKMSPKHNQLGIIAKAGDGSELGRYAISLWPIGNDELNDATKDVRQKPQMINNRLVVLNRAVLSVELSKANTWYGLPEDTKQIHVANLNQEEYKAAMGAVKEYAEKNQYFNDYEVTNDAQGHHTMMEYVANKAPEDNTVMPPVTSNTMLEYVVNKATGKKVFDEGRAKISYRNLHVKKDKTLKKPVSSKIIRGLMANKQLFNEHYNKDMFIVPAYYDKDGNARTGMMRDDPEEWYVVWTSNADWRQNYMKAEKFQRQFGFKSATTEAVLDENQKEEKKSQLKLRQKLHKKHKAKVQTPVDEAEVKLRLKEIEQQEEEHPSNKPKPKIEAWYINMAGHTDRKECMEIQLKDQGFEPHREEGVQWPKNGHHGSINMNKLKAQGFADCVPNGIDVKRVEDHSAVATGLDTLRANILSNYCGHKRLIEKLAHSNSTAEYFLIFEDDAQLKPWFRLILEDFVQNYQGPWSAVQIDPFWIKSSTKKVKDGLPKEYNKKHIYHGGILSGIQTLLVKKERINEVISALNANMAMPADHIGRYVDSMIAWKPYISTHPGWFGEKINEKCPKTVSNSRIARSLAVTRKFLASEGFPMELEEEILDNSVEENPDDNGPLSILNNLAEETSEIPGKIMNNLPGQRHVKLQ